MTEKKCAQCGEPFIPREAKQRFCCRACSAAFFQEKRRLAVALYRALPEQPAPVPEIDLRPAQLAKLSGAEPMSIRQQDRRRVSGAIPPAFASLRAKGAKARSAHGIRRHCFAAKRRQGRRA